MSALRRVARWCLGLGLLLLLGWVAAEIALIALADVAFHRMLFTYDPDLGFRARAYATWEGDQTNAFGFLDRDYPLTKAPGTYRVLGLSDSFGWIGGKAGNYTKVLERRFAEAAGPGRVEVINAGYPGTHTGEELAALRKFGLQYRPDLVVLGFFVGNDIIDAHPRRRQVGLGVGEIGIDPETDREIVVFGQPVIFKDGWRFQSRLRLLVRNRWIIWQHAHAQPPARAGAPGGGSTGSARGLTLFRDEYLHMEGARMAVARRPPSGAIETAERFALRSLRDMRDLVAERRIDFLVFLIPDEFQVDPALRAAVLQRNRWQERDFDWARPQARVLGFCAAEGIVCVDLLPVFQRAHAAGQRLYLPNDSHWNDAGIALAVQALFDRLKDRVVPR